MRIAVTLTFEDEVVWSNPYASAACLRRPGQVPDIDVTPKVQFCGEFFVTGETKEFEVQDRYTVIDGPLLDVPSREIEHCTHVLGEWDAGGRHDAISKWMGCSCTGFKN